MNKPIEQNEVEFLNRKDLISMVGQKKSTAQRFLETNIELPFIGWLERQTHPSKERTAHDLAIHYDAGKLRVMHRVGTDVVALVMLVGPLWLLAALEEEWHKLISISLLLLVFLTVMNWGIVARPFEVLAATAGSVSLVDYVTFGMPQQALISTRITANSHVILFSSSSYSIRPLHSSSFSPSYCLSQTSSHSPCLVQSASSLYTSSLSLRHIEILH